MPLLRRCEGDTDSCTLIMEAEREHYGCLSPRALDRACEKWEGGHVDENDSCTIQWVSRLREDDDKPASDDLRRGYQAHHHNHASMSTEYSGSGSSSSSNGGSTGSLLECPIASPAHHDKDEDGQEIRHSGTSQHEQSDGSPCAASPDHSPAPAEIARDAMNGSSPVYRRSVSMWESLTTTSHSHDYVRGSVSDEEVSPSRRRRRAPPHKPLAPTGDCVSHVPSPSPISPANASKGLLLPCTTVLPPADPSPATDGYSEEELERYSRVKCSVCGQRVELSDIDKHSRVCVVEPIWPRDSKGRGEEGERGEGEGAGAPQRSKIDGQDKWSIAVAGMTSEERQIYLSMRRKEELKKAQDMERRCQELRPLWWIGGCFGFVISARWLRLWRSFVGVGKMIEDVRDRPPGPISNLDLFELDGQLRTNLKEGIKDGDFHVLPQPLWEFYLMQYGGGPAIIRYSPSGNLPGLYDHEVSFTGDWKDWRPNSGSGRVFDPVTGLGFDGSIRDGFMWTAGGRGMLPEGSFYEGTVRRGVPEGRGVLCKPDGTTMEGSFVKGRLHGQGRVRYPRGRVIEGEWEYGELCGI
ncbi:unnamed protein product [Vitrella brassicaformis CCMP3155]|uniref:DUSP domain-containing protein n=3 Tax=Vitrella brassicaformis TaxID=1169539 RepID=A0A0G4ELN1_VITBC|nr:unnamed protein product [Vitrella brassicaformis CCMP3155]|eukprot:CEL97738.1 unnamed protein product [Vitrella brassicaformis CCMP3155]